MRIDKKKQTKKNRRIIEPFETQKLLCSAESVFMRRTERIQVRTKERKKEKEDTLYGFYLCVTLV